MNLTRGRAVLLIAAAPLLSRCGGRRLRIGSKDFVESVIVAEIYALALESAGMRVERHMIEGNTEVLHSKLSGGKIDLYPEYTGTGLLEVLHQEPTRDPKRNLALLRREYERRFDCTWLDPAPANDSQGMAVTRAFAQKFNVRTLSQCARAAPELRLAATPDFVTRADSLPGLQGFYGGFRFKSTPKFAIGSQYDALLHGAAEVAVAFTTDAQIGADHLVILRDDRGFWPRYNVAPVIRRDAWNTDLASKLNAISPRITDDELRRMNAEVQISEEDPAAVAWRFVKAARGT